MRPDKRCASHVSLSPRVTAPVAKTRCAEGGRGQDMCAGGIMWVDVLPPSRCTVAVAWLPWQRYLRRLHHERGPRFATEIRRVASRRVFVCLPPFCEFFPRFLHRFWQQHFCIFFSFFCPETQMDIAICVIRAVPPASSHLNPLCVPPKEQAGACFSARCFSLHSFLCFCHVLSTIVANTRLDPNLTRSNNLESFLISRHHQRGTANREQGTANRNNNSLAYT